MYSSLLHMYPARLLPYLSMDEREHNRIMTLLDTVNDSASDNDEMGGNNDCDVEDYIEENVEKDSDVEQDVSDFSSDLSRSVLF